MEDFQFTRIPTENTTIHLLKYSDFDHRDYYDVLTPDEQERCLGFKHDKRKREFVATRILRHRVFGFEHIHYDHNGAPFLKNGTHISISHCQGYAAIAENNLHSIGLDLELPRSGICNIMHKFLSEKELASFDCTNEIEVSKIWSAKEALYKLAGRKKILFSSELHLIKETDQIWKGRIINHDHELHVNLNIFEQEGLIITINNSPVERI